MSDFATIFSAAAQGAENFLNRAQSTIDSHTAYKRQKKLMAYQNQFNIQQWERENEYNLPSNIRKRLEDAGINPYTAMTGGNSSPVSNISPVGLGSAPAVPTPHTSSLADVILNARQVASNVKVNEATESKILAEKDKVDAEAAEIRSRTPKEHNTGDVQNAYTISQTPTEKNTGDVQNEYTSALTEGQRISNVLNRAKIRFADQTAEQEFELLCYSVINAQIDGDMKRATAQKMLADALLANAQAGGQKISNTIAQRTANQLIERTNIENLYWTRQAHYGAAKDATPINISIATGDRLRRDKDVHEQAYDDVKEFNDKMQREIDEKLRREHVKNPVKYVVPRMPLRSRGISIYDFRRRNPKSAYMSNKQIIDWLTNYYTKNNRFYKDKRGRKYLWLM